MVVCGFFYGRYLLYFYGVENLRFVVVFKGGIRCFYLCLVIVSLLVSVEKVIEMFKDYKRIIDGRGRNIVVIVLIDWGLMLFCVKKRKLFEN